MADYAMTKPRSTRPRHHKERQLTHTGRKDNKEIMTDRLMLINLENLVSAVNVT